MVDCKFLSNFTKSRFIVTIAQSRFISEQAQSLVSKTFHSVKKRTCSDCWKRRRYAVSCCLLFSTCQNSKPRGSFTTITSEVMCNGDKDSCQNIAGIIVSVNTENKRFNALMTCSRKPELCKIKLALNV